ncbi:MAG: hypothetical protein WB014_09305 [Methanosarcina sp.]
MSFPSMIGMTLNASPTSPRNSSGSASLTGGRKNASTLGSLVLFVGAIGGGAFIEGISLIGKIGSISPSGETDGISGGNVKRGSVMIALESIY